MEEAIAGISGGISGLLATLVWYPLENVRIRLQQKYLEEKKRKSIFCTPNCVYPYFYKSHNIYFYLVKLLSSEP